MNILKNIDGSKFLIDPRLDDDILIGRMIQYPEFKAGIPISLGGAIRYMILMYDFNNGEIQGLYPDYSTRKRSCAVMAGFKIEKNRFEESVESCLIGESLEFNKMIVRYIRLFNNPDYVSYCAYWEMLVSNIEEGFSSKNASDIKKIRENIDNLRVNINELADAIFKGDSSIALRKALYATMEEERLRLRPEDIANDIFNSRLDKGATPLEYIATTQKARR